MIKPYPCPKSRDKTLLYSQLREDDEVKMNFFFCLFDPKRKGKLREDYFFLGFMKMMKKKNYEDDEG